MEVAKLRQDLTHCWLAEVLVQVLERVQVCNLLLVSLGDATIAEQGTALSELVKGFLRRNGGISIGKSCHAHVNNVDELHHRIAMDGVGKATGVLVVVYAPCEDEVTAKRVEESVSKLQNMSSKSVLLVLNNPTGLLGLEARSRAMESCEMYHIQYFGVVETWERTRLKFIAQPLENLRDQCGWHFVIEIVRQWFPESTEAVPGKEETFGAARAKMFSSINQLPFQLLLLVLRWSHFHPELLRACAKKLQRQTQLIPQERVRRDLAELQRCEAQVWRGLYPLVDPPAAAQSKQEQIASPLFLQASFQSQAESPKLSRLSECRLWDTQKQFYKDLGIRAWSSGAIPFGVSSSSFLAGAYARIAIDFLLSNASYVKPCFRENGSPNCFVWEAASGSCKFLYSFMLHFTEAVEADDEFKRRGLKPLIVATDLSEQVLSSRRQMACFRPFIERGQLDFALFDTHDFVHGNVSIPRERKTLGLLHSKRWWHVGSDGPVALMGNYFLDSLRADIFTVASSSAANPSEVIMQAALLDEDTSSITDMEISLRPITDPKKQAFYEDARVNATLVQVLDKFRSRVEASSSSTPSESVPSTGLVLFPVEAFEFFLALFDRDDESKAYPIAILAGDARFSFRDPISSAFVTTTEKGSTEQVSLEVPQLSPHPDCFCLPVDFEIFKLFFERLNNDDVAISASSELVSAPASDTFDVFLATVEPQQKFTSAKEKETPTTPAKVLHMSFKHQFARFTPGDCDLLWGMMSFDDGARCFSVDTLLALMVQAGWDFDLFAVLHWELLNRLRRQEVDSTSEHYQKILIDAGKKSWRTFYHMEQQTDTDITTRETRLQLARWFFELEAYDTVLDVLVPWRGDDRHKDSDSDDVDVFYLLGLTSLRMEEYWTALSFFRLCARRAPTKLKFQRQVARTLLALQTLRSASNSSNESEK